MFRTYRVGSIAGFPIEMNLSFLLILGIVLITTGLVSGLVLAAVLFGSVLLHELGHALMARHLGVHIAGIELHFFGGAAKMSDAPRTANDEVAIAAAGPAVSFALGGFGLVLASLTGWGVLSLIGWVNMILGAFNLIPALPMDGGRILRALLTRKFSFIRATEIAVKMTRAFAIALGVFGVYSGNLYLPLMAVLLWILGSREIKLAYEISGWFGYDRAGYRVHDQHRGHHPDDPVAGYADASVEVLPADYWNQTERRAQAQAQAQTRARPFFSARSRRASSGFVIRQHNGRWYIETIR